VFVGTIDNGETLSMELDTSGKNGDKNFYIILETDVTIF